jgi:SAM-dependent methyltransferase
MLSVHKQNWEELAATDPLWAILSDPAKKNGKWELREFLDRGEAEISAALSRVTSFPRNRNRALDFGCGVGRLTRAMSTRFQQCVGVDISEQMIAKARELNRDCNNCEFLSNASEDLRLFPNAYFDFIYTSIVLQHLVHRASIFGYIQEFCRLLNPGGLLIFQVPSYISPIHRLQPVPRLYNLGRFFRIAPSLLMRLGLHPIRMAYVPKQDVLEIVTKSGMQLLDSEDTIVDGMGSCTYWLSK